MSGGASPGAVHQVVSTLEAGDAVGGEVLLLQRQLRARGFASDIHVAHRHGREPAPVHDLDALDAAARPAVVLYHVATASQATDRLVSSGLPLVVVYHNVTPAVFFWGVDMAHHDACLRAVDDLRALRSAARLAVGHSEFSRRELEALGFERTAAVPLLLDTDDVEDATPGALHDDAREGAPVLLTAGRVAPNKCIEDVLRLHHALRHSGREVRLWIAGDASRLPRYAQALQAMAERFGEAAQVRWLGAISRDQLVDCYRGAALYVSMSEHEGFGGTLVEAMRAGTPVLAHDAGAVAETLGGAGALLPRDSKHIPLAAEMAARILDDEGLRRRMARRGRRRAAELSPENAFARLLDHLHAAGLLRAAA